MKDRIAVATRNGIAGRIETPSTSFDFSHGLDLRTYEGSTVGGVGKRGILSVVDTADPGTSPVLRKTVPGMIHGGGSFWDERAPDYLAIKRWIAEGAKKN